MYKHMWSNTPNEAMEFHDYHLDQHFGGRSVPSFLPRQMVLDYFAGRCRRHGDLRERFQFGKKVERVAYDEESGKFTVAVRDLNVLQRGGDDPAPWTAAPFRRGTGADIDAGNLDDNDLTVDDTFDAVVTATGHYSAPNVTVDLLPGIESFPGRILHSHDFRNAEEFAGLKVLVVGGSTSAEDIALQCIKYGAESALISWRTQPLGLLWPKGVSERPSVAQIRGDRVTFADGGPPVEFDAIILCTGYRFSFPFMENRLTLRTGNHLHPRSLYRGMVFLGGGNNRLLYMGMQKNLQLFFGEIQSAWIVKYLMGDIQLPEPGAMQQDVDSWHSR